MSDEMKQSAELFAQDVFEYSKLLAENADLRARLEKALHDKDVEQKKAVTLFDAYEAAKAWLDKTEQERDSRITEEQRAGLVGKLCAAEARLEALIKDCSDALDWYSHNDTSCSRAEDVVRMLRAALQAAKGGAK